MLEHLSYYTGKPNQTKIRNNSCCQGCRFFTTIPTQATSNASQVFPHVNSNSIDQGGIQLPGTLNIATASGLNRFLRVIQAESKPGNTPGLQQPLCQGKQVSLRQTQAVCETTPRGEAEQAHVPGTASPQTRELCFYLGESFLNLPLCRTEKA